jgi:hypothetical protein
MVLKVYVNEIFLSHIKPPTRQRFSLSFPHELFMIFKFIEIPLKISIYEILQELDNSIID